MKAIVMAGGEGTRLRPVSSNRPKPMVNLLDEPVLAHILRLLKAHGFESACLTLRHLPQMVTAYVGDGRGFGLSLESRIENAPLGTAGGVKACADFVGDEDFLVISGDAVCDFDLSACMAFHKEKNADATIVLYAHPDPLEYGLVMTAPDGQIQQFVEKPAWSRVFTNLINTGVYILSPRILEEIPDGPYDFGKDLFPKLLAAGKRLYGLEADGYWCDIGSCEAYLQSAMDALAGRVSLDLSVTPQMPGIWSHVPLPEGVILTPPVYIGRDAVLEAGARIGPAAVIGAGSRISQNAVITRSIVDGAVVEARAQLEGAVVCRGASIGADSMLNEGCVVGECTILGAGSFVAQGIRIWPGRELPFGSRVTEHLINGNLRGGLRFAGTGVIGGECGVELTPDACFTIGAALSGPGRTGIGFSGEDAARLIYQALQTGICWAGGDALSLDAGFPAAAAYAADLYGLPRCVFAEQDNRKIVLHFFGKYGQRITREQERKLEAALAGGDIRQADAGNMGGLHHAAGIQDAYISSAARWSELKAPAGLSVSVSGAGSSARTLRKTLEAIGCTITDPCYGTADFHVYRGGFLLRAMDETGTPVDSERLLTILAFLEFEAGSRAVAVPYSAPRALEHLARRYSGRVLRLGKDPETQSLYYRQPYLRDGIFAAARLIGAMSGKGATLASLSAAVPDFSTVRREVPLSGDKAAVMRALSASCCEMATELIEGLQVDTERGRVRIVPSATRPVLKINGEGADMEAAEALCGEFECRAREIDGGG